MPSSASTAGDKGKLSRRHLLSFVSSMGLAGTLGGAHAASPGRSIEQPAERTDRAFIERAFAMKTLAMEKGDQAYGAVVVNNGIIIGESWSRVVIDSDPTGHAEMSAIRDASRRAGSAALRGATLYSSSPPCSMCQAAANWVGINMMVYGESASRGGAPRSCG